MLVAEVDQGRIVVRKSSGSLCAAKRPFANFGSGAKRFGVVTVLATASTLMPALATAQSVLSETDWPAALGRGYDSHLGRIADGCVKGTVAYRGTRSGVLTTHFNESFGSYMSMTEGKLSGSVNLLLVSGSASVDYYSRVSSSDHSVSLNVRFVAEMGSAVLDDRTLTSRGETAVHLDAAQRRAACGDEFIYEAKLGSELQIGASFHFADQSELERFTYTVKVEALFGLVSSTERWTEETSSFSETGYLVIDSLQRGGDPSVHQSILSTGTRVCPFHSVTPCWLLLRDLIEYASSSSGYNAQFSSPYQASELALIGYRTIPFEVGGHDELVSPPAGLADSDIKKITPRLIEELARQTTLRNRAAFVLTMPISDSRRARVEALKSIIESNIVRMERAIWVCQTTSSAATCRAARDEEAATRQPVLAVDLYF